MMIMITMKIRIVMIKPLILETTMIIKMIMKMVIEMRKMIRIRNDTN